MLAGGVDATGRRPGAVALARRAVWLMVVVGLVAVAPGTRSHAAGVPGSGGVWRVAVGDRERRATVVVPVADPEAGPVPVVMAFHGRRSSGPAFRAAMRFEDRWPGAVVVYPDGVVGRPGSRTDPQGRWTGWQVRAGDAGDADVAFFDTLLAAVRNRVPVDPDRIFLVGHSNGSRFVGVLAHLRGPLVAATANLSGPPGEGPGAGTGRSVLFAVGDEDRVFPRAEQYRSVRAAAAQLGLSAAVPDAPGRITRLAGRGGVELVVDDYRGGHQPPPRVAAEVVAFFRRHARTDG